MRTEIRIDDHGAAAELAAFPALLRQATVRTLNRTAEWARTRTLDAIVGNLALKRSDLDGRHRFGGVTLGARANRNRLVAGVSITGARIPLYRFGGSPTQPPNGVRQTGISYKLDAGGGRTTVTKNAFVARMPSGHVGFFQRVPGADYRVRVIAKSGLRAGKTIEVQRGIHELRGPSIPHVADNQPEFKKLLEVDAGERLELQMHREVNFILTGTSKGET